MHPNNTTANTSTNASAGPEQTSTPANTPNEDSTTFKPLNFSGTGQVATQSFNWPGGMMRVTMTHQGNHNFIIKLLDSSTGEPQQIIVNEIGSFTGSKAFNAPEGIYVLDVTADGPWTVKITR